MSSICNLIRPDLKNFTAYSSARSENKQGSIWLNANELPYDELSPYNRYPKQQPTVLVNKLAALYQIEPEKLLVTRGSDEGIDLIVRLFCTAYKDRIITCPPTFGMYAIAAKLQGVENKELKVTEIIDNWGNKDKIIFLCSPNNPTGESISLDDISGLCDALDQKAIVVVDEAYIEFSEKPSAVELIDSHENLIILRTLSKAYGMAAVRCGCVLANEEIIQWLKKIIAPYPIAKPIVDYIEQFLKVEDVKEVVDTIKAQKSFLFQELKKIPSIKKVWPSDANFILIQVDNPDEFCETLLKAGVVVRRIKGTGHISNAIRISIGRPAENQRLLEVLR